MKTATWGRDSHGLFDYEDLTSEKRAFNTQLIRFLIRKTTGEVELIRESEVQAHVRSGDTLLFKISPQNCAPGTFYYVI